MRTLDTKAKGTQETDGSFTMTVTISGLRSVVEANAVADALRVPVREAVVKATKATSFEVQDMQARPH